MKVIKELRLLGYDISLRGNNVKCKHKGRQSPKAEVVKPLLEELRKNKPVVIAYLQSSNFIEKTKAQLNSQGYAKIQSKTLGEVIYFCRDDVVAARVQHFFNNSAYTMTELEQLANGKKTTKEQLQQIHAYKKEFSGRVVDTKPPEEWRVSDYSAMWDKCITALTDELAPHTWTSFFDWLELPEQEQIGAKVKKVEDKMSEKATFREALTTYYRIMLTAIQTYCRGRCGDESQAFGD